LSSPAQGEIAGVKVLGIVDLLDFDGCVFDFKTAWLTAIRKENSTF
jgi:hypothetical protein